MDLQDAIIDLILEREKISGAELSNGTDDFKFCLIPSAYSFGSKRDDVIIKELGATHYSLIIDKGRYLLSFSYGGTFGCPQFIKKLNKEYII